LDQLAVKLAQRAMNVLIKLNLQFFARRVTIHFWETENVHFVQQVLHAAHQSLLLKSVPRVTIQDKVPPIVVSAL
jgi:hypothetical protein